MSPLLDVALRAVARERDRQEKKFGATGQTCANPKMPNLERLAVLAEEFGEVAQAVCKHEWDGHDQQNLRDELVQVAAVAVAWVEGLDA